MQPSQASNETKLPRAVIKRSAAIAARYAPKPDEPDEQNPAEANAPAPTPAAAPPPPADTPPTAPAGDPRSADPAYWEQRFRVTQGILSRERVERQTEREGLHQQVAELNTQLRSAQVAKPDAKIDVSQFFSPDEVEKYGQEQCEAMARVALKAAGTNVAEQIAAAVQPLQDKQTRTAADEATRTQQVFVDKLLELYPNYPTADKDPRWLAWLADDDENGAQRQAILDIHIANRDARGCARMFKTWEKTTAPAPASTPTPAPPVAPSGSGAAPGADAPDAPRNPEAAAAGYPSKAEVKDFYKRSSTVRKGQPGYVTDDERIKFEARLALRNAAH